VWPLLPCHLDLPARHPKHERVKVHIIRRIFLDGKAMVDAGSGLYFGGALIPPALGCLTSIAPCQKHNASDTFLFDGTFDGTFLNQKREIQHSCWF